MGFLDSVHSSCLSNTIRRKRLLDETIHNCNLLTATASKLTSAVTLVTSICKVPSLNLCGTPAVLGFSEIFLSHSRQIPCMGNLRGCGGSSCKLMEIVIMMFACSDLGKPLETSVKAFPASDPGSSKTRSVT